MQPNVHLDVAELISMDVEMILMLGCTFRATFFFLNFSGTQHAAGAAAWLLSLRDGREATVPAVAHPCCLCTERWGSSIV